MVDVHSFQQFHQASLKVSLEDAVAHYLDVLFTTIVHWLLILSGNLQNNLLSFHLQNLAALIKINLRKPFTLGIKRESRLEDLLSKLKGKTTTALDYVSRHSLSHILTYQLSWASLASFRDAASILVETFSSAHRIVHPNNLGRSLAYAQSWLSWFDSFKHTTPTHVNYLQTAFADIDLLKNNVIENTSYVGRRVKGMALNGTLGVGAYLDNALDYLKDHQKAATESWGSVLDMMNDAASFIMKGVFALMSAPKDYLRDHEQAASDSWGSMLAMMTDVASFCVKGMFGFVNRALGHLPRINIIADVSPHCFKLVLRIMTTCATPMIDLSHGLLDAVATFIVWSEYILTILFDYFQDWLLGFLDFVIDRQLELGLCMMVGSLAFILFFAVKRRREQTKTALHTVQRVSAVILYALGYFLKAPVEILMLIGFVPLYIIFAVKGLIRFSRLDQLHLELKLRLHAMPGAWVTYMDEKPHKGLFRSTLHLELPPTPASFSSLPITIRTRIYELALTDKTGFKWDNRMKVLRSNLSPSLLRVSYNTRLSTLAIPFNMNKIIIDTSPKDLVQQSIPKELQRHLLPQAQPCGREQLLDLLTSLRIPRGIGTSSSTGTTTNVRASNDTSASASTPPKPPLPHLGALLSISSAPWVVEIREPYTRIWAFDMHTIVSHLRLVPSLIVNYTITIPPGAPRPLSKAQHLARQLSIAAHQGSKDRHLRVYVQGLQHWENLAMGMAVGAGVLEDGDGNGQGQAQDFLSEGKTDFVSEVAKVERAVERMNEH